LKDPEKGFSEKEERMAEEAKEGREWMAKDPTFPRPFKKFRTLRFSRSEVEKYWAKNTLESNE
jgi:hypothetical protein